MTATATKRKPAPTASAEIHREVLRVCIARQDEIDREVLRVCIARQDEIDRLRAENAELRAALAKAKG